MRKAPSNSNDSHKKPHGQPADDQQRYSNQTTPRKHHFHHQSNEGEADSAEHGSHRKTRDSYWNSSRGKPSKEKDTPNGKAISDDVKTECVLCEENEYLCSECRTSKIDSHLVTLKKLREKALRYTNQLDDIRSATKKREKELVDVMERLQLEEKHLHEQLENVDQLSFKMNMKRNQIRQDQMSLQHEESEMAQRLQALKEKEIFVNCQMVKLQSQEAAIKHRKRELHKEKLRIEKLAYLIFKTDLSTMTYREFHTRLGKMQNQLERRYRKLKVMEHYCQHKTLPAGMKLEPITPVEQCLDPAVAAFEEVLWGTKTKEEDSSNTSIQIFSKESPCCKGKNARIKIEKLDEKSQSRQSLTTKTEAPNDTSVDPHQGRSSVTTTLGFKSDSSCGSKKSRLFVMTSKKSKSEQRQECQIILQEAQNLQRLVMSAKETTASVHRLLQTPLPELEDDQPPADKSNSRFSCESNPEDEFIPEDYDPEEEEGRADGNESIGSFNSDVQEELLDGSSNSDGEQEIEDETEIIHRRISQLESNCRNDRKSNSKDSVAEKRDLRLQEVPKNNPFVLANSKGGNPDENGVCSIFRNSKNDEEKVSSQSLIHPETHERSIPFKYNWKKSSEESISIPSDELSRRKRQQTAAEKRARSSKRAIEKSGNDGDRFDYEDVVNDRLSRLSETTRNEIVYALGQKALAQVAEAMDRVANRNPPSRHGDQSSRVQQGEINKDDSKNSELRSRSPSQLHDSYLQSVRRGLKSAGRKGPRRIPSHLKFGNFNIRQRGRKNNDTYRQVSTLQSNPYDKYQLQPQDSSSHTNPIPDSSSQDIENTAHNVCNYHEENYSAEVIAEKILGIHTVANPGRRKAPKVTAKLSHTRAFRV
ncbi:unnamed protein product [Allacma fusca]|uniref:Uncharacterized protein n=1 Tax=Allacma fusca TaxID=39272 RepID=A0A8J2PSZ3_9HEXA|nr:unnamed protein product [Allacma fusca]